MKLNIFYYLLNTFILQLKWCIRMKPIIWLFLQATFSVCDSHLKSKRCRNPAKCAFRYLTCFSSPFIKRKCYNYWWAYCLGDTYDYLFSLFTLANRLTIFLVNCAPTSKLKSAVKNVIWSLFPFFSRILFFLSLSFASHLRMTNADVFFPATITLVVSVIYVKDTNFSTVSKCL